MKHCGFTYCELLAVLGMLSLIICMVLPSMLSSLEVARYRSLELLAVQLEGLLSETALYYPQWRNTFTEDIACKDFDYVLRNHSELFALTPWVEDGRLISGVYEFKPNLDDVALIDYTGFDMAILNQSFQIIYEGQGRFTVHIVDKTQKRYN